MGMKALLLLTLPWLTPTSYVTSTAGLFLDPWIAYRCPGTAAFREAEEKRRKAAAAAAAGGSGHGADSSAQHAFALLNAGVCSVEAIALLSDEPGLVNPGFQLSSEEELDNDGDTGRRTRGSSRDSAAPSRSDSSSGGESSGSELSPGSPVREGAVSTLELRRADPYEELGVMVVGGSDTPLDSIVIQEVLRPGLASRDARLLPGDRILKVNGVDIGSVPHEFARAALAEPCRSVRLHVLRDAHHAAFDAPGAAPAAPAASSRSPARRSYRRSASSASALAASGGAGAGAARRESHRLPRRHTCRDFRGGEARRGNGLAAAAGPGNESLQVVLRKRYAGEALGIRLAEAACGGGAGAPSELPTGVMVQRVLLGGVAAREGALRAGDRVIAINGRDVRRATTEQAVAIIQSCQDRVHFVVSRQCRPHVPEILHEVVPNNNDDDNNNAGAAAAAALSTGSPWQEKTVRVSKAPHESLGMTVAGGLGSLGGDLPIYVTSVDPHGSLGRTRNVRTGDVLLSVNGTDLTRLAHAEAVAGLKAGAAMPTVELHMLSHVSATATSPTNSSATSAAASPTSVGEERGAGRRDGQRRDRPPRATSTDEEEAAAQADNERNEEGGAATEERLTWTPSWVTWLSLPSVLQRQKEIVLARGMSGSLGFSIVGGLEESRHAQPFLVKHIVPGTPAFNDGRLRCGDRIVAVNGRNTAGMNHAALVRTLKELRGKVSLTVVSLPGSHV
ncbi:ligand of Numb protein X 2-like isoform X2 [Petromyzon marinus]|uniref:Ligand of Numb protein X 2-like isoform X2 n=1 Tax=Petromyzon marinus TaxID=7757 RepID=A0AAJ7T6B2_PETMA|nr:ligand of Numb protein X 2-like isoform X2 [Petromyzon marinus]